MKDDFDAVSLEQTIYSRRIRKWLEVFVRLVV